MLDRFYCPELFAGQPVRLEGPEAHHLARVLRKSVGEVVELFDGSGRQATAEITGISKKAADLRLLDFKETPPPGVEIILASAVPKGDRFRWLVEKATELGVDRLIPLITERSVVKPGEGKREKMEQAVIEACKQSGRNRLMRIEEPTSLDVVLEVCNAQNQLTLFAHPAGQPLKEAFQKELPASIFLLVGPEGGWAEEEVAKASAAGAVSVSLAANILRIETAAIALSAFATFARAAVASDS
jgi:16S rRNA (uracil1498-N3)-methyltransferase